MHRDCNLCIFRVVEILLHYANLVGNVIYNDIVKAHYEDPDSNKLTLSMSG